MNLKENERIDDLQLKGLKIIQNPDGFCFGIDAVLLSDFAKNVRKGSTVIDLCTGTGIVAILLAAKTAASKIIGVELQPEMADMAGRSVQMNGQQDRIEIIQEDVKNIVKRLGKGKVDAITVNPPYQKAGSGIINERDTKTIARHEVACTLEEIIEVSAELLNSGGCFDMVHRTERLVDVLTAMRKAKLEPKRIRFVHPSSKKAPNLFLVEGIKYGKPFLKVEEPIYVYDEAGNYTCTIKEIYHLSDG